MRGRNVKANNLYAAETTLLQIGNAVHELSLEVGVAGDGIHFDGERPKEMGAALDRVLKVKVMAERVEGLLRAYEMMRTATEGASDDYATAG